MRSAIRNRMTPPARLSERSDNPKSSRRELPKGTHISSTASAIAHSRTITRTRRFGATCRSRETNKGMLPIGSVTSSRMTTAEVKEVSMARAYPADRERDDTQRHRSGGGDAARHVAFPEPVGPHQRGKQDTDLACRRDIADRREHHRSQHEDIGERAEQGDQDHALPLPGPGGPHLSAAPERHRSHHDHPAEVGAPVLEYRRDQH